MASVVLPTPPDPTMRDEAILGELPGKLPHLVEPAHHCAEGGWEGRAGVGVAGAMLSETDAAPGRADRGATKQ